MSNQELLRTKIEREMVHAPGVRTHRDDLNDRINAAQREIGGLAKWSWLERLTLVRMLPPLTLTSSDYTTAPPGAGAASALALSFLRPTDYEFNDVLLLTGHTVTIDSVDYIIERAFGTSLLGVDTFYIVLDPRFTASGVTADVVFNLDRYVMPRDMYELYGIMSRSDDYGPLREVSLKGEEWFLLNRDDATGDPVVVMSSPNLASAHTEPWIDAGANDRLAAPLTAPTLASASGGSLNSGQEYEYYYVWVAAGMVSAPSPVATITLGGGDGTVNLSAIETALQSGSSSPVGRERWIFRRTGEGPWNRVIQLTTDSSVSTAADAGTQVLAQVDSYPRARDFLNGGHELHMRMWPPPSTRKDLELRYLSRIPSLEAPTDVPFMPVEFRDVLVHFVCRDLSALADNQNMVRYHDRRYNDILKLMKRRGLVPDAQRHVRRSLFQRGLGFPTHLVQPPVLIG